MIFFQCICVLKYLLDAEIDGLLDEIRYSDIHRCGPVQDESDIKVLRFGLFNL